MPDRGQLLKDFYTKYAPQEELSKERLNAINKKYGNDDKALLSDFYAKYAPQEELSNERFAAIEKKYGLSVKKKENEEPLASSGTASSTESGKTTQRPNFVSPRNTPQTRSQDSVTNQVFGGETPTKVAEKPTKESSEIPITLASKELLEANNIKPQSQFSDLGALNKEVVTKVTDNAKNAQVKNAQADFYDKLMDVILPSSKILPNSIRSSIISSVAGFQAAAGGVADKVSDALFVEGSDVKKNIDKFVKNAYETAEMTNEVSQGLMRKTKLSNGINPEIDTVTYFESGNIVDGVKSLFSDMGGQAANMAMQATGVGGIIASGVSSFGSAVSQEVKEDGEVSNVDFLQSALQGSIDGVLAKFFNVDILAQKSIIKGLGGFLTKGGSALAKEVAEKGAVATKEKIIRTVADIGKKAVSGGKDEVKEELLATSLGFAVDLIDKDEVKVEDFQKLYHDLKTSALLAITMGGGASTIAAGFAMKKLTKEQNIEIGRYESILNDENTSKVAKDLAKRRISQIQDGVGYEADQNLKKAQKLNLEDKVKVNDLKNKIEELETDIDNSTAVQVKDDLLELKNVLVTELETILNSESGKVDNNQGASVQGSGTSEAETQASSRGVAAVIDTTNRIIEQSASIQEIETRMNNAEEIDEKEINNATDQLYQLLDEVQDQEVTEEVRGGIITAIEDKIKKLEGYEFETTTEVIKPEQERKVLVSKQIVGETSRGSKSKSEVTTERFIGKGATVNESDGVIEYNEEQKVLSVVHDDGRTDLDFNYLEYQESLFDEDGNIQGVKLVDTRTGDEIKINDQDLAYDIAIKEKMRQIGDVTDSIFDEVYDTVVEPAVTKTTIKSKTTKPNFSLDFFPNTDALLNTPTGKKRTKVTQKGRSIVSDETFKDLQNDIKKRQSALESLINCS